MKNTSLLHRLLFCFMTILAIVLSGCGGTGKPSWQEQYDLGMRYLEEGNYSESIVAFSLAIEIDPKRAEAYIGRGSAYAGEGGENNLLLAADDYELAIKLDETNPDTYINIAHYLIKVGNTDRAEEYLRLGMEKTNDTRINEILRELLSDNVDEESNREEGVVTSDDGAVEIKSDGEVFSVSLTDPNLKSQYDVNIPSVEQNMCEYAWLVRFTDGANEYEVGTTHWNHGEPGVMSVFEMQSDVWLRADDGSARTISNAELRVEGNTMIWDFTIPEEYHFNQNNMTISKYIIENVNNGPVVLN